MNKFVSHCGAAAMGAAAMGAPGTLTNIGDIVFVTLTNNAPAASA